MTKNIIVILKCPLRTVHNVYATFTYLDVVYVHIRSPWFETPTTFNDGPRISSSSRPIYLSQQGLMLLWVA